MTEGGREATVSMSHESKERRGYETLLAQQRRTDRFWCKLTARACVGTHTHTHTHTHTYLYIERERDINIDTHTHMNGMQHTHTVTHFSLYSW